MGGTNVCPLLHGIPGECLAEGLIHLPLDPFTICVHASTHSVLTPNIPNCLSQAAGAQLELPTLKHRILKTGNLYGFSQWPRGGVGGINAPASLSYLLSCPWTRPILRCGLHLLRWAPAGVSQGLLHGTSFTSFLHRVPGKCIITSLGFLPSTAHFHSPLQVFPETHPNKSLLYKFLC